MFEVENKGVADWFYGRRMDYLKFSSVMEKCRKMISLCSDFSLCFIMRQANLVAHNITRASRDYSSFHIFNNPPICIVDQLTLDIMSIFL